MCREATLVERRNLENIRPKNLRQINHLDTNAMVEPQGDNGETHLTIILRATAQLDAAPNAKAAFLRAAAGLGSRHQFARHHLSRRRLWRDQFRRVLAGKRARFDQFAESQQCFLLDSPQQPDQRREHTGEASRVSGAPGELRPC